VHLIEIATKKNCTSVHGQNQAFYIPTRFCNLGKDLTSWHSTAMATHNQQEQQEQQCGEVLEQERVHQQEIINSFYEECTEFYLPHETWDLTVI